MKTLSSGTIEDSKLSLSWTEISDFSSFNIKIGKPLRPMNFYELEKSISFRSLWRQSELLQDQRHSERARARLHARGRGVHQVHHLQHPPRGRPRSPRCQGRHQPRKQVGFEKLWQSIMSKPRKISWQTCAWGKGQNNRVCCQRSKHCALHRISSWLSELSQWGSYITISERRSVGWQMRRCWWSSWAQSWCSSSPSPSSSVITTARKSGGDAMMININFCFSGPRYI